MTLRDKFLPFCDNEYANREDNAENCVDVADDYAVEFAEWLMVKCDYQNHCVWEYKGTEYTNFKLLEIFKKEKGL